MALIDEPEYEDYKHQYEAMINDYLQHIPLHTLEDFPLVISQLEKLAAGEELLVIKDENNNNKIHTQIIAIKELLDEPEMFVRPQDFAAYKTTLITEIRDTINRFNSFNDYHKQEYINRQNQEHKFSKENKVKRDTKITPLPKSHTFFIT